jgi:hypothetical protein
LVGEFLGGATIVGFARIHKARQTWGLPGFIMEESFYKAGLPPPLCSSDFACFLFDEFLRHLHWYSPTMAGFPGKARTPHQLSCQA